MAIQNVDLSDFIRATDCLQRRNVDFRHTAACGPGSVTGNSSGSLVLISSTRSTRAPMSTPAPIGVRRPRRGACQCRTWSGGRRGRPSSHRRLEALLPAPPLGGRRNAPAPALMQPPATRLPLLDRVVQPWHVDAPPQVDGLQFHDPLLACTHPPPW